MIHPALTDAQRAGAAWRISSYSSNGGGNCVEVAPLPGGRIAVRHSQRPQGTAFVVGPWAWAVFVRAAADELPRYPG